MKFSIKILPLLMIAFLSLILAKSLHLNPNVMQTKKDHVRRIEHPAFMDYKNRAYIIHFWASWCETCKQEHAVLAKLTQPVIGVLYKDPVLNLQEWQELYGNSYDNIVFDPQGAIGLDLGVVATPETFVVDKTGHVRLRHQGPLTASMIENELNPLMERLK